MTTVKDRTLFEHKGFGDCQWEKNEIKKTEDKTKHHLRVIYEITIFPRDSKRFVFMYLK